MDLKSHPTATDYLSGKDIVVAVEDQTTYRALQPVVSALEGSNEIQYLLLNVFFESTEDDRDVRIPHDELNHPVRDAREYLTIVRPLFRNFQYRFPWDVSQKLLLDYGYDLFYNIDGFLNDTDPDLVLSGVDQVPFLRHLIHKTRRTSTTTAVIQQGTFQEHLSVSHQENRRSIGPTISPQFEALETLKRRVGYPYGITMFTHPYIDQLFTFGEFFTRRIADLRGSYYPTRPDVTVSGPTEFGEEVVDYQPETDSVLVLSQQFFERGDWTVAQQIRFFEFVIELSGERPVTFRPHPKDSSKKIRRAAEYLDISMSDNVETDVAGHDVILTVSSTAIYPAIIMGKVCGILQLPWYEVEFPAFTHDHLIQVRSADTDIEHEASKRNESTQRDYLRQFCHMPGDDETVAHSSSVDVILSRLAEVLSG